RHRDRRQRRRRARHLPRRQPRSQPRPRDPAMSRVLIALVLVVIAVVVALIVERRRPAPPTQPTFAVPAQLDRDDFTRPDAAWLVAVFTSVSCGTCADVVVKVRPLESDDV